MILASSCSYNACTFIFLFFSTLDIGSLLIVWSYYCPTELQHDGSPMTIGDHPSMDMPKRSIGTGHHHHCCTRETQPNNKYWVCYLKFVLYHALFKILDCLSSWSSDCSSLTPQGDQFWQARSVHRYRLVTARPCYYCWALHVSIIEQLPSLVATLVLYELWSLLHSSSPCTVLCHTWLSHMYLD